MSTNRVHYAALITIVLLSIVLRLAFLSQPMRFDEAFTFLRFVSKPLSEGLTNYSEPNNHLFHTLLVHIVYSLFGDSSWVIRLPALLAGIALVPQLVARFESASLYLIERLGAPTEKRLPVQAEYLIGNCDP